MGIRKRAERMLEESDAALDRMELWIQSTGRDLIIAEQVRNKTLREVLGLKEGDD